jgi:hypothetical protein
MPHAPSGLVHRALNPKPELLVHRSDRPETVRALLKLFQQAGDLYDRGGVLVTLVRPADGGPPIARPLLANNVIVEAHQLCQPVRFNKKGEKEEITLPTAVAQMLLDLYEWGVPPLAGITTAPLLEPDGSILIRAGYTSSPAMWCEPVPNLTVPARPTRAEADAALLRLRKAFRTFPFADSPLIDFGPIRVVDLSKPPCVAESAFIHGRLTACCRASLWLAPGLLVVAPEVSGAGSGKGLLVRAICLTAFGHPPKALTAGHDRQELDKRLVSALVEASSSVFLDNVNSTALRSDTLASVLTERPSHVRIFGRTQMVPLNCAAFIAVTGNGLSVSEDLARRFIGSLLDPQCEDPEVRPFAPGFLAKIAAQRADLLSDALTIWRWGRQNAHSLTRGLPFGSFETWAEWVRDPLLTLGCPDPVEQVQQAKASDQRRQNTLAIFAEWWQHHMAHPMTATQLAVPVLGLIDPQGRGRQFVAARLMQLTGTRAGGFVLTRQRSVGKWSPATYALLQTNVSPAGGTGSGGQVGHGGVGAQAGHSGQAGQPGLGNQPGQGSQVGLSGQAGDGEKIGSTEAEADEAPEPPPTDARDGALDPSGSDNGWEEDL